RFCETDSGGHVNNASYFFYFEEARTKFFTSILEQENRINFILARAECDYVAQAFSAQTLTVKSSIAHIGTKSFTIVHEIYEKTSQKLIAKARAIIVCFDFQQQKSVPISDELRAKLAQYINVDSVQEV
ncbi:MAG: acyl-CoA thioesterase, partial [Lysinibacillus sp.]